MVLDAPWSSSVQQAVIDTLRSLFPDKPVGILAFTHYHSDHFGRLRPFLTAGSTLVTTSGNRGLIERVATASHPSDPAATPRSRPASRIETFAGTLTIADAEAPVELHELGGGHADEMVVAYLPRQQVLFAADLLGILPARGSAAGWYEAERMLARYTKSRRWVVRTVVSGHGTIDPGADLEATLSPSAGPEQPLVACSCPKDSRPRLCLPDSPAAR